MIEVALTRIHSLLELGGPVVALLMAMSVVALAVTIWKVIVFEIEGIGRGMRRGFLAQALKDVRLSAAPKDEIRNSLHARLQSAFGQAAAGLRVLDVIAQVAPLLGLFGTVLGMIDAFRTLQGAGSTADPSILAGGIWVALMTTAAGLVVAIPSSLVLSWFDSRLEAHRRLANEAIEQVLTPDAFAQAAPSGAAVPHAA